MVSIPCFPFQPLLWPPRPSMLRSMPMVLKTPPLPSVKPIVSHESHCTSNQGVTHIIRTIMESGRQVKGSSKSCIHQYTRKLEMSYLRFGPDLKEDRADPTNIRTKWRLHLISEVKKHTKNATTERAITPPASSWSPCFLAYKVLSSQFFHRDTIKTKAIK